MSDVQMTHSDDCWQWHHECAKRVVEELTIDKERLRAENKRLRERLALALEITAEQAEDEGLWCPAVTSTESYLQQELRRLHAAVEGER